jgi:hypothetical protein
MMDEEMYLHTLDTEAYEAALAAAIKSLSESDLLGNSRLRKLAGEDGVVAEAAAKLLATRVRAG